MSVAHEESAQFANTTHVPPIMNPSHVWHGRLRVAYFSHTRVAVGDIGSNISLVKLPAGSVRVLRNLSFIAVSDNSSSSTLDVGHKAYVGLDGVTVVEAEDFFISALDTASAATLTAFTESDTTSPTKLFESRSGVEIFCQIEGGAWEVGNTVNGYVTYVVD